MARDGLFWLSHSKVQSFFRCRKQYWFEYLSGRDKPEPPLTGPGVVGTGVHRALRYICESGEAADGRNELDVYLRMTEPDHKSVAGPGTDAFELAHKLYDEGCMVHDSIISLERHAELAVDLYLPDRGIKLDVRIDRADKFDELHWQIIDWKTGRLDRDDETDGQLDLGHLALRSRLRIPRDARVTAVAWNLRTKRRRVRELTRADAASTVDRYERLARRMQEQVDFPATPGPHCSFCRWQPQCPESDQKAQPDWDYPSGSESEDPDFHELT